MTENRVDIPITVNFLYEIGLSNLICFVPYFIVILLWFIYVILLEFILWTRFVY